MIPVAALRVSASAGPEGPVVVLSGEADPTTAAVLREMLAAQLDTGTRLLTVDASGLSFLDSASVRVLVLAARALQGRHGRLVLARPQPVVARLLEITGADRLLDVRELAGPTGVKLSGAVVTLFAHRASPWSRCWPPHGLEQNARVTCCPQRRAR